MGQFLSVIPFRKAIDSTVTGAYCKQKSEPQPMRDEHFKNKNLDTITFLEMLEKKIGGMGLGSRFLEKKIFK